MRRFGSLSVQPADRLERRTNIEMLPGLTAYQALHLFFVAGRVTLQYSSLHPASLLIEDPTVSLLRRKTIPSHLHVGNNGRGIFTRFHPLLLRPLVAPPGSIPVAIKATLYYNAVWQYILIFNSAVDRSSYAIHHAVGCITGPEQKRCMSIYIFMFTCVM